MTQSEINKKAQIITNMMKSTNTDYRGNVFEKVGIELKKQGQYYTGNLFLEIANTYGIDKSVK